MRLQEDISKAEKRDMGRTDEADTPLEVHGKMQLSRQLREEALAVLGHALGHNATAVERVEAWFEDENGPKGGIDVVCRVTLVMAGQPNIFADARGEDPSAALALVAPKVGRALTHAMDRRGFSAPKQRD